MVTGRIHICWYQNPPLNVVQTAGGCAIRAQPICLREVRRGGGVSSARKRNTDLCRAGNACLKGLMAMYNDGSIRRYALVDSPLPARNGLAS